MMKIIPFVVFFALIALAHSMMEFSASFKMYGPLMTNGGYMSGTVHYSWSNSKMSLEIPSQGVNTLYQWNANHGFADTISPYTDQFVYRSGAACNCEIGTIDYGMLPLFLDPVPNYGTVWSKVSDTPTTIEGATCYEYKRVVPAVASSYPNRGSVVAVPSDSAWFQANGNICKVKFLRATYVFSNVNSNVNAGTTFTIPSSCKCSKPLDIMIVLDRSCSISLAEFRQMRKFLDGFIKLFEFDSDKANMGIVNFNTDTWVTLSMQSGVTNANVKAGVESLTCCNLVKETLSCNYDPNTGSPPANGGPQGVCRCNTCIPCGVHVGGDELKKSVRGNNAPKIFITITDGYINHKRDATGKSVQCAQQECAKTDSCTPTSTINPDVDCDKALRAEIAYVKGLFPAGLITFYGISIGADRSATLYELLILSDEYPAVTWANMADAKRAKSYADFESFGSSFTEIAARTCETSDTPCGLDCCGYCVCGKCVKVDGCDASGPCQQASVPAQGVCCSTSPVDCTLGAPPGACQGYVCDDVQGCLPVTDNVCPQSTQCVQWACDPQTGQCGSVLNPNNIATCDGVKECLTAADCNDFNACTDDTCDAQGNCVWTPKTCSGGDACNEMVCDRDSVAPDPCVLQPRTIDCNDNNNCTVDSCDAAQGCMNVEDPAIANGRCDDNNFCTKDLCDPINGCTHEVNDECTNNCPAPANGTCFLCYCNETSSQCVQDTIACEPLPLIEGLAAGLGTAAIIGIIVGVVVCLGGCVGGGAFAVAKMNADDKIASTWNNPLFQAKGSEGSNALYQYN